MQQSSNQWVDQKTRLRHALEKPVAIFTWLIVRTQQISERMIKSRDTEARQMLRPSFIMFVFCHLTSTPKDEIWAKTRNSDWKIDSVDRYWSPEWILQSAARSIRRSP